MTQIAGRKTALYEKHVALGAKIVPFAGYLMPLQYSGQIAEHEAVRGNLGIFDLSHMGEFRITGPDALAAVDRLVTNRIVGTDPGQVVYSPMCRPDGGIVDDLLVYNLGETVLLVVNASNLDKDRAWIMERLPAGVRLLDESYATSLIAVQGPHAEGFLQPLTAAPLAELAYYRAREAAVAGVPVLLSRTGYTGEDGFELYVADARAPELWDRLAEAGAAGGMLPIGLAARDTLRFEMGYCLYGNDIDDTTSPLEAGLGWTVKLDKADFVGKDALARQKAAGLRRRLVGLAVETERAVPRKGVSVMRDGRAVGMVTSGTFSPSLGRGMAMAYVPGELAAAGTPVELDIRGRTATARVTPLPFYAGGTRKVAGKSGAATSAANQGPKGDAGAK